MKATQVFCSAWVNSIVFMHSVRFVPLADVHGVCR